MTPLKQARNAIVENLGTLKALLEESVHRGMPDPGDAFYNEILALIDEARISEGPDELQEVIVQAKTVEADIDAWFARHGQTTVGLEWPTL